MEIYQNNGALLAKFKISRIRHIPWKIDIFVESVNNALTLIMEFWHICIDKSHGVAGRHQSVEALNNFLELRNCQHSTKQSCILHSIFCHWTTVWVTIQVNIKNVEIFQKTRSKYIRWYVIYPLPPGKGWNGVFPNALKNLDFNPALRVIYNFFQILVRKNKSQNIMIYTTTIIIHLYFFRSIFFIANIYWLQNFSVFQFWDLKIFT